MPGVGRNARLSRVPGWLTGIAAGGLFLLLLRAERSRALRGPTQPKGPRLARNLALAATGALALNVLQRPLIEPLSQVVARRRLGLLGALRLPLFLEVLAAVLLLDYTLYLWHLLTHRVPFLWRFHLVHHLDLDLDASTALRFHFGELSLSVLFRAAQVLLLGISPLPLSIWQGLLLLSILFQHSDVRLGPGTEARLSRLLVTPVLHGIHHGATLEDTDSNWSSGLTLWDRLHGTLRLHRAAEKTGVPGYRDPAELTLLRLLELPFTRQRPAFKELAVTAGSVQAS